MDSLDLSGLNYALIPYENVLKPSGKKRNGVIIKLSLKNGTEPFWSEASPLEGFSKETTQEAYIQLEEVLALIAQNKFPQNDLKLFPSVSFGLDSGLFQLTSSRLPISLPLSGLLMGTFWEITQKAERLEKQGYKSAKLKISQLNKKEALDLIYRLKNRFLLRIDINRAWNLDEALDFFAPFKTGDFDYIEEPLKNPHELKHFSLPIALDESLKDLSETEMDGILMLKALVYKPTLQGGIACFQKHLDYAQKRNLQVVLSSAFETGIGILNIAALSKRLKITHIPAGLDTYGFIEKDFLTEPLDFTTGFLKR